MSYNFKEFIYECMYRPVRILSSLIDTSAIILIYHRVTNLKSDPQLLAVKPDNFYNQIKYLKENYNLLTIEQFVNIKLSKKKFPPKSLIITFDDGYHDNYSEALPILSSVKTQALFFITTALLNTEEESWWDKMDQFFDSKINFPSYLNINNNFKLNTSSSKNKINAYHYLHKLLKYSKPANRESIINQIIEQIKFEPIDRDINKFMTFDEIKSMNDSHFAVIGAHTHTHTPLSILTYNEQKNDIEKSVAILENLINKKIEYFSYPFGTKKDYNKDTFNICKELNFKVAFANYYSQVHRWTNNYNLPRVLIRDWNINKFKKEIKKAFRY